MHSKYNPFFHNGTRRKGTKKIKIKEYNTVITINHMEIFQSKKLECSDFTSIYLNVCHQGLYKFYLKRYIVQCAGIQDIIYIKIVLTVLSK